MKAMLNDALLPVEEAKVSVLDRGFLYGDAVFETVAAANGKLFRLARHWERFLDSARRLGLPVPFGAAELEDRLGRVLRANDRREAVLRFTLSRGSGPRGLATEGCRAPTFVVLCFPPRTIPPAWREQGAKLALSGVRRIPGASLPPEAKTANCLNGILARREAAAASADEALMLTVAGDVAEATASNVFLVCGGECVTPHLASGILPGVTRAAVIELARSLGLPCSERAVPEAMLERASEIFCTNTTAGVMPVGWLGSRRLDAPGPITRRLDRALADLVRRECS